MNSHAEIHYVLGHSGNIVHTNFTAALHPLPLSCKVSWESNNTRTFNGSLWVLCTLHCAPANETMIGQPPTDWTKKCRNRKMSGEISSLLLPVNPMKRIHNCWILVTGLTCDIAAYSSVSKASLFVQKYQNDPTC